MSPRSALSAAADILRRHLPGLRWTALILILGLGLRLAWAWYSPARPLPPRFDDSVFYYQVARNLAAGGAYIHPATGLATAQWPPGYPFFLALLFKLFGPSVVVVQIANALLGSATAILVAILTKLLFRNRAASIFAGLFAAAAPGSVLMAGLTMSETFCTFLIALALVLIVLVPRMHNARKALSLLSLAIVVGLAGLTRESALALVPTAAAYWLLSADAWRPALRWTAVLAVGVGLMITPWTLRNYRTMDALVFLSSSTGGNFWQGNHASTGGRPDVDIVATYGPLTRPGGEVAVSHAGLLQGLRYVRMHPWQSIVAPLHRVQVLYQGDQGGLDWNDSYGRLPFMSARHRHALAVLCDCAYYLLLALAGIGLLHAGLRSAGTRLIVPLVATWTMGHALFVTEPRYHLPLLPVFAVAAGVGCSAIVNQLRSTALLRESRSLVRAHQQRLILVGAALPALIGFGLLTAGAFGSRAPSSAASTLLTGGVPPAIYARSVCSFSNEDAAASLVQGADGGASLVVGDRTYWLFGDTLFLPESGKQIEQNTIASSSGSHADGCPELHYYARDGIAVPFLPKDGSLTVWPVGAWAVDDHSFDFYTAYVYGSGPTAYSIGEVGVAHTDTRTMQTTVLARDLWDGGTAFAQQVIGAQPVDLDGSGRLRVVLQTNSSSQLLARVEPGHLGEADAYEFWDGSAWSRSPAQASPLWPHDLPSDPVQRLAAFENGTSIGYNSALGKYVALENIGIAKIGARIADRLEGPWSDPQPWIDCSTIAAPAVPTCYSPFQHPELTSDRGRRLFITFTRLATYDTVAYELTLGTQINEYESADGEVAYAANPPSEQGWRDRGVAFYASDAPLPGFAAVYRWQRGAEVRYAITVPDQGFVRGDVAFYAPATELIENAAVRYQPVFDWHHGTSHLLAPAGASAPTNFEQGGVAFYAP